MLWASSQDDRFSATTVVAITPAAELGGNQEVVDVLGPLDRGSIVATAAGIASSGTVTSSALADLGAGLAGNLDEYEVESLQVLESNLIDVTVTGPDAEGAAAYANAIAAELQATFADFYPVYEIRLVTEANPPSNSGRPGTALIVIGAAVLAGIGTLMLWLAIFGARAVDTETTTSSKTIGGSAGKSVRPRHA